MRLVFASLLLTAAIAHGQGIGAVVSGNTASNNLHQPNDPYTLIVEFRTVRTLADGTHLTSVRKESVYRDTLGRTRVDNENNAVGAVRMTFHTSNVSDTVAGKTYFWSENPYATTHEYSVREIRPPASARQPTGPNGNSLLGNAPPPVVVPPRPGKSNYVPPAPRPKPDPATLPQTTDEQLGTHDVQGFSCKASRKTTTYPVDYFGNDRPLVVTEEQCYSQEITHQLEFKREDPRVGTETMTVLTLSRGEPDASLFRPPAGYTEHQQQTTPLP